MRDPVKTSKTVSVQGRVDNINRLLYNETRNVNTDVRLGIASDRIYVICFSNNIETIIYECLSCKHLYKILDDIMMSVAFERDVKKKWWFWFTDSDCENSADSADD